LHSQAKKETASVFREVEKVGDFENKIKASESKSLLGLVA
jgi:hypothetical protein